MKTISIFNNKGGVGKTTYIYHIAHLLAQQGKRVLLVDCDSQANLTAYCLRDEEIVSSWEEHGNSIYRGIELVYRGLGDVRADLVPIQINSDEYPSLFLIPGDIRLSNFEDFLGDSWNSAKGGSEPSLRIQSAIHRLATSVAERYNIDAILYDLGPNLGALNRAILGASDYFITPIAPDLFSLKGTENLGQKLLTWRQGWRQCNEAAGELGISIPRGEPSFLGYVVQRHNIRNNEEGMTRGWQIYGERIDSAVSENIVNVLQPLGQVHEWADGYNLGQIPNLHSLIPYSLEARRPVFDCNGRHGLTGAHISRARESRAHFDSIITRLLSVIT